MNRRSFLASLAATAGGLVLPYEPRRVYSFGEDVGRFDGDFWTFGVDRSIEASRLSGLVVVTRVNHGTGIIEIRETWDMQTTPIVPLLVGRDYLTNFSEGDEVACT